MSAPTVRPTVTVTKVSNNGKSLHVLIPKGLAIALGWRKGDPIAARDIGGQLVLERIAVERMSRVPNLGVQTGAQTLGSRTVTG